MPRMARIEREDDLSSSDVEAMNTVVSRKDLLRGRIGRRTESPAGYQESPTSTTIAGIRIDGKCLDANGTTCRLCEDECVEFAIQFQLATRGRAMPLVDAEMCTGCLDCLKVCPTSAIHPLYEIEETVS